MGAIGLACSGSASPGDDGQGPTVSFANPEASFFEDTRDGEFVIGNIVVTDPAGVAKVGVRVGPVLGDLDVNVVGRTVYSPNSTDLSFRFPWAEVAPSFTSGTPPKKITVSVVAVDVFGNVSESTSTRAHTIRSRVLWMLRPMAEGTPKPVFVDSMGEAWVSTANLIGGGRIVHVDPDGNESCSVTYAERVNGISEARTAGPNQEDLIVFGTDTGVRAVPRADCLALGWDFVDTPGKAYAGHPVHDADRTRLVALNTVGEVVFLDAAAGTELSRIQEPQASFVVSPIVTTAGNIYAGSAGGNMYRYTAMMTRLPPISTAIDMIPTDIRGDPALFGSLVYFGAYSGIIYQFDDADPNSEIRKFLVTDDDRVDSRPAIAPDGTILTTTLGTRTLFALAPADQMQWQADLGAIGGTAGAVVRAEPADEWSVYIGDTSGVIHALDKRGNVKWRIDTLEAISHHGTIFGQSVLYINTIQTVYAIDLDLPLALP